MRAAAEETGSQGSDRFVGDETAQHQKLEQREGDKSKIRSYHTRLIRWLMVHISIVRESYHSEVQEGMIDGVDLAKNSRRLAELQIAVPISVLLAFEKRGTAGSVDGTTLESEVWLVAIVD